MGSSPRMRGTHRNSQTLIPGVGLIPTYAGNTGSLDAIRASSRAHPHVCGEHHPFFIAAVTYPGSSPRMRGTQLPSFQDAAFAGLIPTYAGNTLLLCEWSARAWAHPHVCGEHHLRISLERHLEGSSPRMRGTPELSLYHEGFHGLIPTYAGNTNQCPTENPLCRAHPHVCGEHLVRFRGIRLRKGSSPRMRGTPREYRERRSWQGLIPTYAGNTVW